MIRDGMTRECWKSGKCVKCGLVIGHVAPPGALTILLGLQGPAFKSWTQVYGGRSWTLCSSCGSKVLQELVRLSVA
jgi:hypothetical protein